MNILIDATTTQTKAYSGIGQYSKNIIERLIQDHKGFDYHLILFDGASTLNRTALQASNVTIHRVGKIPGPLHDMFHYWLRSLPVLRKVKKEYGDLVFFSPYYRNGFPISGVPSLLTIHDFAMPKFNYYSDRGPLINLIRKVEFWYQHDRSEHCSAIITNSDFTAVDYLGYYPNADQDKVFIAHLGIDLEFDENNVDRYLPHDWRKKGYVLYLGGGIQKSKNSQGVIKSYAKYISVLEKMDGVKKVDSPYLVIAGKIFLNRSRRESILLYELIDKLGLSEKVHFSGFYEDEAKYSLIKNCKAFIHLSLFEGFGIAVAEAMKVGVPVIAHNGSSYKEVVGDGGFLVDGTNPDEVSDVLYNIHQANVDIESIIERGKNRAKKYDWTKCAMETSRVLSIIYKDWYK